MARQPERVDFRARKNQLKSGLQPHPVFVRPEHAGPFIPRRSRMFRRGTGLSWLAREHLENFLDHTRDFLRYHDGLEQVTDDEDEVIAAIVASMAKASGAVYRKHRHGLRGVHAKSHGILAGELRVRPGLSEPYRQGVFADAATYPVIVRLSTAPGDLRSDQVHSQGGLAIKVIGLTAERAIDDGATTQDFLLVNSRSLPFGTVHAYAKLQSLIESQPARSDAELRALGRKARSVASVLRLARRSLPEPIEVASVPNHNILGETFHSVAALRYGDYVAKISAAPRSPSLRALTGTRIGSGESALRDVIVDYFKEHDAEYDIRVQLCADLAAMPIEDASVAWPESLSPHVPVASLYLPAQNAYSDERRIYADDVLFFSPWHAVAAHRPLGSIMRSRAKAYAASSRFRHAVNCVESREPGSISELPD